MDSVSLKSFEDLNRYSLILPSKMTSLRTHLEEILENKKIALKPVLEANTNESLLKMVRQGLGIGFFFKEVIDQEEDKDSFVECFVDEISPMELNCYTIEDYLTVATKKFIEMLKDDKKKN